MARYFQRDIKTFDDGEIDLSGGDIAVGTTKQSQRQLMIVVLNTTRGGFKSDPSVGWGAQNYIGKPNTPMVHQAMRQDLGIGLADVEDLAMEDIDYTIVKVDLEEAGVVVRHNGIFLEADGTVDADSLVLGWKFSFLTGEIEPEA